MGFLRAAVGTRDHLRVVGEEVEPLLRVNHELGTIVALELETTFFLISDFQETQIQIEQILV